MGNLSLTFSSNVLYITNAMTFGERIRALRQAKGFSFRQVRALTGFDHGNLSKIENGKLNPPDPHWVIRLAHLYEADLLELLVLADAPGEIIALAREAKSKDFIRN